MEPITYEDILQRAKELEVVQTHKIISGRNGHPYLRINTGIYGWDARLGLLREWVEEKVGVLNCGYSHNPVRGTVNFTLKRIEN